MFSSSNSKINELERKTKDQQAYILQLRLEIERLHGVISQQKDCLGEKQQIIDALKALNQQQMSSMAVPRARSCSGPMDGIKRHASEDESRPVRRDGDERQRTPSSRRGGGGHGKGHRQERDSRRDPDVRRIYPGEDEHQRHQSGERRGGPPESRHSRREKGDGRGGGADGGGGGRRDERQKSRQGPREHGHREERREGYHDDRRMKYRGKPVEGRRDEPHRPYQGAKGGPKGGGGGASDGAGARGKRRNRRRGGGGGQRSTDC